MNLNFCYHSGLIVIQSYLLVHVVIQVSHDWKN
jgi:hypothetical protein